MSALTWPNGTPVTQAEWDEMKRKDAAEDAAYVLEHGRFNVWRDLKINVAGSRVEQFGDWLVKLGCRIQGNGPMGLDSAHNMGSAGGLSDSLRLLFQSTGRMGGLLTAILRESNLTTEELAAKTKIAVGRVRELQDDAVATPEEVWAIKSALFTALWHEEDRQTAEFYQRQQQERAAAKVRQAAAA
jgi:hypothetical protein